MSFRVLVGAVGFARCGVESYGAEMTRLPLPCRVTTIALLLAAGAAGWSGGAQAQSIGTTSDAQAAPSSGDTIRLTDKERQAILAKNTMESAAAARGEMAGPDRARLEVHGEVSAFVGSNGSSGIAGTAAVPLGDHAGAVVSFESSRFGYRR